MLAGRRRIASYDSARRDPQADHAAWNNWCDQKIADFLNQYTETLIPMVLSRIAKAKQAANDELNQLKNAVAELRLPLRPARRSLASRIFCWHDVIGGNHAMPHRGKPSSWDKLYASPRWRRLRRYQLQAHPLCKFCAERGLVEPATIVDHVEPHHGDLNKFWLGKLQSLCKRCHDGAKREIELYGYRRDIGLDGYPLDPNHPCYWHGYFPEQKKAPST
jgi:5-methylcytosine-specific restriction enzyme A